MTLGGQHLGVEASQVDLLLAVPDVGFEALGAFVAGDTPESRLARLVRMRLWKICSEMEWSETLLVKIAVHLLEHHFEPLYEQASHS
jgi:hypothetical protein